MSALLALGRLAAASFGITQVGSSDASTRLEFNRDTLNSMGTVDVNVSPTTVAMLRRQAGVMQAQAELVKESAAAQQDMMKAAASMHATSVNHQLAAQGIRASVLGADAKFMQTTAKNQLGLVEAASFAEGYVSVMTKSHEALWGSKA